MIKDPPAIVVNRPPVGNTTSRCGLISWLLFYPEKLSYLTFTKSNFRKMLLYNHSLGIRFWRLESFGLRPSAWDLLGSYKTYCRIKQIHVSRYRCTSFWKLCRRFYRNDGRYMHIYLIVRIELLEKNLLPRTWAKIRINGPCPFITVIFFGNNEVVRTSSNFFRKQWTCENIDLG